MADNEDIHKITFDTNAKKVTTETNKLGKSMDGVNESQKKISKTSKQQKQSFEDLGGGIGNAIKGFKGLIKQMWLMVANPIGAVIAAIALSLTVLFKAFTSTKAGAEKFDQIMAGIGATVDVLRDRVLKIAEAIGKFFSGDFKGAIEVGRQAVSGFGDEVAAEFKKAADATKSLQEVADAMRDLSVSRAELNRDLAKAKEIIESDTAAYVDKKKAIDEVRIAETKQTELELANARKKYDAIVAQNALSDSSKEALQAEADARIALINLETESANNKRKFSVLEEKALDEENARLKAIATEEKTRKKEEYDTEVERLKSKNKLSAELAKEDSDRIKQAAIDLQEWEEQQEQEEIDAEDARLERLEENRKKEIEIEKQKADQKKSIQDGQLNLADKAVGFLSQIAGKNKALQKAAIIAESALGIGRSVIATNASNIAATAEGAALAIPTAGASVAAAAGLVTSNYIALGLGTAANVAATTKALQALGGGSAPSVGAAGGNIRPQAPPAVAFNNTAENQIGQSIAGAQVEQPPIKVYVAESEMSEAQTNVKALVDKNTF